MTSDPAPAPATPTPSDSLLSSVRTIVQGPDNWHWDFSAREVDKERVRERTGIRRGASWVISMRTKGNGQRSQGTGSFAAHLSVGKSDDKTLRIKRNRELRKERGSDGRQSTGGATRKERGVWGAIVLIE